MENKPKTKKECFAQLDEMLSETDKKAIVEAEDLFEFHFTLGLWIRNNWLYDRSEEYLESLSKASGLGRPSLYSRITWNPVQLTNQQMIEYLQRPDCLPETLATIYTAKQGREY